MKHENMGNIAAVVIGAGAIFGLGATMRHVEAGREDQMREELINLPDVEVERVQCQTFDSVEAADVWWKTEGDFDTVRRTGFRSVHGSTNPGIPFIRPTISCIASVVAEDDFIESLDQSAQENQESENVQ